MLSWGEIMLVFLIALLLFGADKIPDFARTAGKMMGEYRKVRDSLRDEIESVKDELEEVKDEVSKIESDIEDNIEKMTDETYREAYEDNQA